MFKEYIRILSYAQDKQHLMPKAAALVFGSVLCSIAPFFMAEVVIARFWSGTAPGIGFLAAMAVGILLCLVFKNAYSEQDSPRLTSLPTEPLPNCARKRWTSC